MKAVSLIIPARNCSERLATTLDSVLRQQVPSGWQLSVTVVDDHSSDKTAAMVRERFGEQVHLHCLSSHVGRAAARQAGIDATASDYIWFLDADLVPEQQHTFRAHVEALTLGFQVSVGSLRAGSDYFWARYEQSVYDRRAAAVAAGDLVDATTANLVVARQLIEQVGGFDTSYDRYGFEDRDLLLRIRELSPTFRLSEGALARHDSGATVDGVCEKLAEAGQYSAQIYATKFPDEYRQSRYGWLDWQIATARRKLWLWPLTQTYGALRAVTRFAVTNSLMPYSLQAFLVRATSALAFANGTMKRQID